MKLNQLKMPVGSGRAVAALSQLFSGHTLSLTELEMGF